MLTSDCDRMTRNPEAILWTIVGDNSRPRPSRSHRSMKGAARGFFMGGFRDP